MLYYKSFGAHSCHFNTCSVSKNIPRLAPRQAVVFGGIPLPGGKSTPPGAKPYRAMQAKLEV